MFFYLWDVKTLCKIRIQLRLHVPFWLGTSLFYLFTYVLASVQARTEV